MKRKENYMFLEILGITVVAYFIIRALEKKDKDN